MFTSVHDLLLYIQSLLKWLIKLYIIVRLIKYEVLFYIQMYMYYIMLCVYLSYSLYSFIQRSRGLYEMNLSSLVSLSRRAAIIMDCVFHMVSRSTVYKTRYQYTLKVFKTFVGQAGRYIHTCIYTCTCYCVCGLI